jgi:HEAT repeat protein
MSTDISQKIDQLANYQAQRDVLELEKQSLIDQLMPPEIKARIEEIEAEFSGKREAVDGNIAQLESEIKEEVIRHGATVKGSFLRVVYHPGRVTWDTKSLDAYARARPELLEFRKQGEPFVSIQKV